MRLVIDTNVFVSAALKANSLPFLVVRWIERHGTLLKSKETEEELIGVLSRPYLSRVIDQVFGDGLLALVANAELVEITKVVQLCRDPKDDKFLELALNGKADLIISGDGDLLAVSPFRNISVLTPAAFLEHVGLS